jgi:mycothiol system anti-sigma-R factor
LITCRQAVRQLWDYLDGLVEGAGREAIEEHLTFCRRCCGELAFAEELRRLLAEHGAQEEFPDEVRARLLATLADLERRGS